MAKRLCETILTKSEADIRKMMDSGWNVSLCKLELQRRGLPVTVRKPKRQTGTPSFKARGHVKVTGGRVDLCGYAKLPRPRLPGMPLDPWNR